MAMTLRDRFKRWWRPAQWDDDHPTERKQRARPNKNALGSWVGSTFGDTGRAGDDVHRTMVGDPGRDFKKPSN